MGLKNLLTTELRGASGWRETRKDNRGNELVTERNEDVQAHDGLNVVLTIDTAIQNIVETALAEAVKKHAPESITAIVMRPHTGEILAMATLPTFDPNNLGTINTNNEGNRVISDAMEPGSTFKTIVISGALNEHIVKLNDTVFCENGAFKFAGRTLHDSEGHHFPNLTIQEVLMHSSNIGAAKVGIQLGAEKLYEYILDFGLGTFTGIPLPNEINAKKFVRPPNKWEKVSIAQIPMGQGVAATRL